MAPDAVHTPPDIVLNNDTVLDETSRLIRPGKVSTMPLSVRYPDGCDNPTPVAEVNGKVKVKLFALLVPSIKNLTKHNLILEYFEMYLLYIL